MIVASKDEDPPNAISNRTISLEKCEQAETSRHFSAAGISEKL